MAIKRLRSEVSGTAPVSATPDTGGVTVSMAAAGSGSDGYLTSTDWNTFNGRQSYDADLTAIAGLTANTGLLQKTAANTWSLNTTTYLTSIVAGTNVTVSTSGGAVTVNASSSSPAQVTFAEASASPNNSVYVESITATSSASNADIALVAKGSGATLAQVPNSAATGGNKRGSYATDLQKSRTSASSVATGDYSAIVGGQENGAASSYSTVGGGKSNFASGNYSTVVGGQSNATNGTHTFVGGGQSNSAVGVHTTVAGGQSNTTASPHASIGGGYNNTAGLATGTVWYCTVGGGSNNTAQAPSSVIAGGSGNTCITGDYSAILGGFGNSATGYGSSISGGYYGRAELNGKFAHASGRFSYDGDAQFGRMILRGTTTTNTAVILTANGSGTASAANTLVLGNNKVYSYNIELVANASVVTGGLYVYGTYGGNWSLSGLIRRTANAGSTALIGTPPVTAANIDAAINSCTVALTADTTLGGLQISVLGPASTSIYWVAVVTTTEVG